MSRDSIPYTIFRQNLRTILEDRGITHQGLADLYNLVLPKDETKKLYRPDVTAMLSGNSEPGLRKIQFIAQALEVDFQSLFQPMSKLATQ